MIKIKKIKVEKTPVYDITVEDNHNFFSNNILVHNCSEITLPTSKNRTAVCCLSSLNLEKYDEWKNTTIVEDLIVMLDNIIQYFIDNAPSPLAKAVYSAAQERSLGLGTMGFHYLLQKNNIPFESLKAIDLNKKIFKIINERAIKSTKNLGMFYGECPDLQTVLKITSKDGTSLMIGSSDEITINGNFTRAFTVKENDVIEFGPDKIIVESIEGLHTHSGRRNAHLIAIAPNANSGIILGTSPSIEPSNSNAYMHQTRAGSWAVKNPYLEKLLEEKNANTDRIWSEIISSKGSIQHMDIFSEEEKALFKTAIELNQNWVIQHAADRQPYVCQAQSINLFFPPKCDRTVFSDVHRLAWKKKLKSLYYVRTATPHRAENVSQKVLSNKLEEDTADEGCVSCQG